jgi:hypothetical protein
LAVAVLAAILLQVITPHTGRLVFWWVFPVLETVALVVMIIRDPGRIDRRTRAARRATIVLIVLLTIGTVAGLVVLTLDIVDKNYAPTVGATALLGRGAALWVTNVVVFSLWFWELDRGGAAEPAAASPIPPSFGFPEDAMPELGRQLVDPPLPRLPVPVVHKRHGIQPDRHVASTDLGDDDNDGRSGDLADHRDPGYRPRGQRVAGLARA